MKNEISLSDWMVTSKQERLNKLSATPLPWFVPRTCTIDVLIVTDNGGSYGTASFGLSAFLTAFDDPLPYTSFQITKANRRSDSTADVQNLQFDTYNLSQYDVILLFGIERPPFGSSLTNAELQAIADFMDQGGGVFATGDHEDLGVHMCGQIPRVNSMRRWYTASNPGPNGEPFAPDQSGGGEHDTIVNNGNQSDIYPQSIHINYRYGSVYAGSSPIYIYNYVKYPHPVLCSPDGVIDVLPDHMHEGLCEVPSNLTRVFNFGGSNIQEYPMVNGTRLKPEVIAQAHNRITNSKFGVIAVLDGHQDASIGRVLVDATWHHFFNINIQQWQNLKNLVDGGHSPTPQEIDALDKYNLIQHYYRNMVYWLAPRSKQRCFRTRGWYYLLAHHSVAMSLKKIPERTNTLELFKYYHLLGVLAKDALGDVQSICQTSALIPVYDKLFPLTTNLKKLANDQFSFIQPELFETVSLGRAVHVMNDELTKRKGKMEDEEFDKIAEKSMIEATEIVLRGAGRASSKMRRKLKRM